MEGCLTRAFTLLIAAANPALGTIHPPAAVRTIAATAKRTTRGHYDVPMRGCTIALDGKVVVEDGRIVDPQMKVARVAR